MFYNFIYYFSIALCIVLSIIGVTLGQGIIAKGAIEALNIQPRAKSQILRISMISSALVETSVILSLVFCLLLLLTKKSIFLSNPINNLPALAIALSIGLSGLVAGIASGFPAKEACLSTARQPFFASKILNFMLISVSFIQTPVIFSFIFALLIWYQSLSEIAYIDAVRLLSAGLAMGIGGIGPAIGLAIFSKTSCHAIGYNRKVYSKLLSFSFITQAIIETPIVFAMVTGLFLLSSTGHTSPIKAVAFLAAALTVGVGNFGPGVGSGIAASSTCLKLAENPETGAPLTKISMLSQGFVDSSVIYCWLISLLIILLS